MIKKFKIFEQNQDIQVGDICQYHYIPLYDWHEDEDLKRMEGRLCKVIHVGHFDPRLYYVVEFNYNEYNRSWGVQASRESLIPLTEEEIKEKEKIDDQIFLKEEEEREEQRIRNIEYNKSHPYDPKKEFKDKYDEIKKIIPSAYISEHDHENKICCDAHKFSYLGDGKVMFAPNAFDCIQDLVDTITNIEVEGGTNVTVGNIDIDEDGIWADTLYFDNIPREILQPEDDQDPLWKVAPNELDGFPMNGSKKKSEKWFGILDPYGEENWNNEQEMYSWRAWWD